MNRSDLIRGRWYIGEGRFKGKWDYFGGTSAECGGSGFSPKRELFP